MRNSIFFNTLVGVSVFVVLFSSCSHDSIDTSVSRSKDIDAVELTQTPETNFMVSNGTLSRYLNLFHKGKAIDKVEPIVKEKDTLAFYVQFANETGWLLISGDKRVTPLLAFSEKGSLCISETQNPAIKSIFGLINTVKDIKQHHDEKIHPAWILCSPKHMSLSKNDGCSTKAKRGIATGMWIAMDTSIRNVTQTSPKLTNTLWHQNYPWNRFTPKINGVNCVVGCGPVAIGQLVYKYYASNPGQNTIPSTMSYFPDEYEPTFSDYTTTAWSYLVPYGQVVVNDDDTTALFLSWMGSPEQMDAEYGLTQTGTDWSDQISVLNKYFTYRNGFNVGDNNSNNILQKNQFCDTLISSVFAGSPVLVASSVGNHTFLIDKCSISETQYVVRYVFDPYHNVTEEEFYSNPSWMFEWPGPVYGYDPDKDTAEFELISPLMNNVSIQMNWGFDPQYNFNTCNYLLRSRTYSYYDGSATISDFIVLSWTLNNETFSGVYHWAHHFVRNN